MARSSTTWTKGRSGNPAGRPKREEEFVTILRQRLNRKIRGVTAKVRLADILIGLSLAGDTRAANIVVTALRGSFEFDIKSQVLDEIMLLKQQMEELKDAKRS